MTRGHMVKQGSPAAAGRDRPRHWLAGALGGLTLAGLLLLVLVYHVAPLAGVSLPIQPLPSVLLQNAEEDFVEAGFDLTPEVTRNARQAAMDAPLEAAPFYYAAMEIDEARDPEKILALLDETLKRDPRHYYARLWRARMYHQTNRIPDAVQQIVRLLSLDPENSFDYVGALVDLASDPRSHSLFLSLVGELPHWSDDFIRRANERLTDDNFLLALALHSKDAMNGYVGALASHGQFERAFLIWQSSLTQDELLAFSWPYDPGFKLEEGSSAFGWLTTSPMATREPDGLYIYYDGRGERTAATQTIMLGQGHAYTLVVSMSGDLRSRGGFFRWTVKCVDSGNVAVDLDVTSLDRVANRLSADFYIPEDDCAIQSVSIAARPSEFTYPARATIHNVAISEKATGDLAAPALINESGKPATTDSTMGLQ